MPKIGVHVPITGSYYVEVDTGDEDPDDMDPHDILGLAVMARSSLSDDEICLEWEDHVRACHGNVFHGSLSELDWSEV